MGRNLLTDGLLRCPHCGSVNMDFTFGVTLEAIAKQTSDGLGNPLYGKRTGSSARVHCKCNNCLSEFNINHKMYDGLKRR